jgi:uncharacterized protein
MQTTRTRSSHRPRLAGLGVLLLATGAADLQGQAYSAVDGVAATAGHRQEPIRIQVDRAVLAASLVAPRGDGPHPAAVVVPGAGEGLIHPSHPLVQRLADEGIAVLVLGKRGVGESTGSWRRESFQQRADDVQRAVERLRERPEIDAARIGLIGHSQGGWIVQLVAAQRPDVRFLVLLAGPGQTVYDQILTDERIHLERRGTPPAAVERRIGRLRWQLGALRAAAPACRAVRAHYLCHVIRYDPTPALERIHLPVLALFAELDPMVPPEPNVELVTAALERAGNRDVTVHVLTGANHDFMEARTGLRDEYPSLSRRYVDGFVDTVAAWVGDRVGPTPPR